jgi:hypothetical protein
MRSYLFLLCSLGTAVACGSSGRGDAGTGGTAASAASGASAGSSAGSDASAGSSAGGGAGGIGASSGSGGKGDAAGAGRGGSGVSGGSGGSTAGASVGGAGTAGVDCQCLRGAQFTVCGVDGRAYDAVCGLSCVPVAIECEHACPCETSGGAGGTGGSSAGAGGATAGAAGHAGGIACGDETCGPDEYCRAGCSGTILLDAGPAPVLKPSCAPLPPACNGTPGCECICGPTATFCTPGATQIQCGCG